MEKTEKLLKNSYYKLKNLPWGAIITVITVVFSVGNFQLSRIDRDIDNLRQTMDRNFTTFFNMFGELKNEYKELRNDHKELMKETYRETKDFHARLYGLEVRYNKINNE